MALTALLLPLLASNFSLKSHWDTIYAAPRTAQKEWLAGSEALPAVLSRLEHLEPGRRMLIPGCGISSLGESFAGCGWEAVWDGICARQAVWDGICARQVASADDAEALACVGRLGLVLDQLRALSLQRAGARDGRKRTHSYALRRSVELQVYVHSKLMLVDGTAALLGSANLNDCSLLGDCDSEIDVLVRDADDDANGFSATLQAQLLAEHLGLVRASADEAADILVDPASEQA
ncbi:hypothetical protein T492DRAFT_853112 [Pavlovales sp. CCMP2436]|nr:hypothetical protein T492DRAFT_853112 [Pavlovales sp. CCMP2436]